MEPNGLMQAILKLCSVENAIKALFLTAAIILIILFNNSSEKKISFCALDTLLKNASTGGLHDSLERDSGEAEEHTLPAF